MYPILKKFCYGNEKEGEEQREFSKTGILNDSAPYQGHRKHS